MNGRLCADNQAVLRTSLRREATASDSCIFAYIAVMMIHRHRLLKYLRAKMAIASWKCLILDGSVEGALRPLKWVMAAGGK